MTIAGRGARTKGSRYELEVAAAFHAALGVTMRRTPNSGGLHIPCDIRGLEGFGIECKRQETIRIWPWLDQAQRQAAADEVPLLVFRRNRSPSFAALPLKDFLGLLAELQEYRREKDARAPADRPEGPEDRQAMPGLRPADPAGTALAGEGRPAPHLVSTNPKEYRG
jgi:hypothetical protein